jgi:hypothetical protein
MKRNCIHCKQLFSIKRNPQQQFCGQQLCQRVRKNQWRQSKLQSDADYKDNQAQANKRWQQRHQDYWRTYRLKHPQYTTKNREREHQRQRQKRLFEKQSLFAKSDAYHGLTTIESGTYELIPVFAKSDALHVEIKVISKGYTHALPVCKETTL